MCLKIASIWSIWTGISFLYRLNLFNSSRHRDSRSGDRREERRDRPNRWSDNRDVDRERDDRRDREKRLNDRLRELANESAYQAPPAPPNNRDRNDHVDRHMFPPPEFNGSIDRENEPSMGEVERERFVRPDDFDSGHRMRRPIDEFPNRLDVVDFDARVERNPDFERPPPFEGPPPFEAPPPFEEPPEFEIPPEFEGPPEFDGPPEFNGPPDFDVPRPHMHREPIMDEGYMRRDRYSGEDDMMMNDYGRPARMNGPPNFYPPPRDGYGPPRGPPMMRGPRPERFPPRGMMGRPPMFHPRGPPHMRGPRPGMFLIHIAKKIVAWKYIRVDFLVSLVFNLLI